MTQAGGSATINGILYQILGTLGWAQNIVLKNSIIDNDDLSETTLIIEPSGGGGDLVVCAPSHRIVEQWKSKSNKGTWSLNQVIEEVIPDLYRAVSNDLSDNSEYLFVTEGKRGKWEKAQQFFRSLSSENIPDEPLSALDNNERIQFFPKESYTARDLFIIIANKIDTEEPGNVVYKKLWHLLSRFRIKEEVRIEDIHKHINSFLLAVVDYREHVDAKRRELCGIILELASKGEVRISPGEILQKARLNVQSFLNYSGLRNTLSQVFERELKRRKYFSDKDVRRSPDWRTDFPVLIITGESGQGKTWKLLRVANEIFRAEQIAIFFNAKGNADKDRTCAADIVWKQGLKHDQSISLESIASRRLDVIKEAVVSWLTICIDDIQSIAEAKALVNYDWNHLGIRLAFTASKSIGRAAKKEYNELVQVVEIEDFTPMELRHYLYLHNREWGAIPADVRNTLRRPLLANIFCDLTTDSHWSPVNEYEIYERYWLRIRYDRLQADFPNDLGLMKQLTGTILDDGVKYPWTFETMNRLGIDSEARNRLEAVGWLRRLENNDAEMGHDRLLNWAVAEALIEQKRTRQISIEKLGERIVEFYLGKKFNSKSLGYVPMDVLWLASDPSGELLQDVPKLLELLENSEHGNYLSSLYEYMLPTLGERIIPIVAERIQANSKADSYHLTTMTKGLVRIGEKYQKPIQEAALKFFRDNNKKIQEVAMKLLAEYPCLTAIDKIWELHKANALSLYKKVDTNNYHSYEKSVHAFRACINLQPEWLQSKIKNAVYQEEPVWELAYQLSNLEETIGRKIWEEVKIELIAQMPEKKVRSLISCIRRFKDYAEIERLKSWLQIREDAIAPSAFSAIVELDADMAINYLSKMDNWDLYAARGWWFPQLILREPVKTRAKLLELMKSQSCELGKITSIYQGYENEMDVETLDFILDSIDREIGRNIDTIIANPPGWMHRQLSFISEIHCLDLLERFTARADTGFEQNLVKLAHSWEGRPDMVHEIESVRLILRKICGSGLSEVINYELAHENRDVKMAGLQWALIKPNDSTVQLLRKIIQGDHLSGNPPFPFEQFLALRAASTLDSDTMVHGILKWGLNVPNDLADYRKDCPPLSDDKVASVLQCLNQDGESLKIGALIILGISGRKDLTPRIRELMKLAPIGSKVALSALIALNNLQDKDDETVELARRELHSPENQTTAINTLLRINTDRALQLLRAFLHEQGTLTDSRHCKLALILRKRCNDKSILKQINWEIIKHDLFSFEYLKEFSDIDDPFFHEFIWDAAFPQETSIWVVGQAVNAIRALAKIEPDAAFRAALIFMEKAEKDRDMLPDLLLDLDSERAIPILLEQMPIEKQTLARWAIGRAFRKLQVLFPALITGEIQKLLNNPDPDKRLVAVELCGWQGGKYFQDELYKMACGDISAKVRNSSITALKRQKGEAEVQKLMEKFKTVDPCRKWSLLEAIFNLADPVLLITKNDPIWIWNIIKKQSKPLIDYANNLLKEKKEEMKKAAIKMDCPYD